MVMREIKNLTKNKISMAVGLTLVAMSSAAIIPEAVEAKPYFAQKFKSEDRGGLVYVMTNDEVANQVLVYWRGVRGELYNLPYASAQTGGVGAGSNAPVDPLGSQNSLVYDENHNMLFGVNAGDNTVFAFDAKTAGKNPFRSNLRPKRTALVSSGGFIPVSVAVNDDLLYVLNAGGSGVVTTFKIGSNGQLTPIGELDLGLENATEVPFDNVMAPGQVGVDTLARRLLVTNAHGQEILSTALDAQGVPTQELESTPTAGVVPFSFDTTPFGNILVTEAGSGAVSVFDAPVGLPLVETASSIANGQAASCWIVINDNGYAYVSNTVSDNISMYSYSRTGDLTLVNATAASVAPGGRPTDMTFANDGGFLYTLDAGSGEISGFEVNKNSGALKTVEVESGLPANSGIQGIAARDF